MGACCVLPTVASLTGCKCVFLLAAFRVMTKSIYKKNEIDLQVRKLNFKEKVLIRNLTLINITLSLLGFIWETE